LEAYVKTNFSETHNSKQNKIIGYGSITDGIYKVEVHILNFTNNDYLELGIYKGDNWSCSNNKYFIFIFIIFSKIKIFNKYSYKNNFHKYQ